MHGTRERKGGDWSNCPCCKRLFLPPR